MPTRGSRISCGINVPSKRWMASDTRSERVNSLGICQLTSQFLPDFTPFIAMAKITTPRTPVMAVRGGLGTPQLQFASHFFHFVNFDLIANFYVVVFHADTTLNPIANFVNVIFKATQGFQLAFKDHNIFT